MDFTFYAVVFAGCVGFRAIAELTRLLFVINRVLPLHDSAEIFTIKMAAWHNEVAAVRSWYQTEHDNWSPVAGDRSKWWVWSSAVEIARKSVVQIQTYLQRISEGFLHGFLSDSIKYGIYFCNFL